MRFNGLDLNLLVALDALLTEKSVTAAGARIHLSQSAVSCALARLREHLNDQLLVSVGRKMVLTPFAEELAPQVREILILTCRGTFIQP
jgi:DNA-binding transcriptional LysR family regulator